MNRIAGSFMKAAVLYGIIGLALGVYMGATHALSHMTVHSHLGLLGWVSLAVCALFYQVVPAAADLALAKVHFWTANAGMIVLAASLTLKARGVDGAETGAGIGSVLSFAALAMFLYVVFRTSGTRTS
ncbi:MAG TPA: cytochrome-c oxidase [Nitrospirota bacterium]|nr:cytochrome-c oxidase [Nitrospirota bacterium]